MANLRLQCLFARECQQLTNEAGCPVRVLRYLCQIRECLVTLVVTQKQKIAMPRYGCQKIIEVMRNTARKLSNCLHFLTLYELRLERL